MFVLLYCAWVPMGFVLNFHRYLTGTEAIMSFSECLGSSIDDSVNRVPNSCDVACLQIINKMLYPNRVLLY